ncbi:MAG TPA: site-2 protease family protein [Fibrobacter sp.]|nr:site-2 protease family protein [Fibrobacter sp.]
MANESLRLGVLYFVAIILSLAFHEASHALAAYLLGDSTAKDRGRLSLNPLVHLDTLGTIMIAFMSFQGMGIGWAKPVPVDIHSLKKRRYFGWVSVAGPLSNLLLAALGFQFLAVFQTFIAPEWSLPSVFMFLILDFFKIFVLVNIALTAFNLIPIYPLDGAKVLSSILPGNMSRQFDAFFLKSGAWPLLFLVVWEWFLPFPGPLSFIFGPFTRFLLQVLEKTVFWIS